MQRQHQPLVALKPSVDGVLRAVQAVLATVQRLRQPPGQPKQLVLPVVDRVAPNICARVAFGHGLAGVVLQRPALHEACHGVVGALGLLEALLQDPATR